MGRTIELQLWENNKIAILLNAMHKVGWGVSTAKRLLYTMALSFCLLVLLMLMYVNYSLVCLSPVHTCRAMASNTVVT